MKIIDDKNSAIKYKKLEDILEESSPVKYEKFLFIKEQAKDILPKTRIIFPEFNNHDIKHAEGVLKSLNEIIPKEIKNNLTDEEIFCLLCAAWLHDIGMVPKNKSEEDEFKKADDDKKMILKDKIRDKHNIRSYNFIKKDDSFKLDRHEKDIIANVCRSHRKINIQNELLKNYRISSTRGNVRLQLLGALLRIADECDITLDRVSKHYIEESRSNWAFITHIRKHELVDDVFLSEDETKLIIRGQVTSNADLEVINDLKKDIEDEINEVQDILKDNGFNLDSVVLDFDKDALIEKEIILVLSDLKEKNLNFINSALSYDKKSIKRNLDNLEAKNHIFRDDSGNYTVSKNLNSYREIFELFYGDDNLKKFIDYDYSSNIIRNELFNYLRDLYNFILTDKNEINMRIEILKNSPTAIYLSLHGKDIFDPQLNLSLIQGQCLLDQLIMLGFHYDMYRYPMEIKDIEKFIKSFINPLCGQICKCVPKSIKLYDKAQENARKKYSEKFFDLTSEEKGEGKYKFNIGIRSKKGEPNIMDLISASRTTGHPIEITGDRLSRFELDEKFKLPDKYKDSDISAIKLFPGKITPINLQIENTKVRFDNLLFRLVNKNEMSTEDRNLPYKFGFSFDINELNSKIMENGKFHSEINPNSDAIQVFEWEEFIRKLSKKNQIMFIDANTKKLLFKASVSNENVGVIDDFYYSLIQKLSYIQKKIRQVIIIPEHYEIKQQDIYNTDHALELLNNGETEIDIENVELSLKVIDIKQIIQLTEKNKSTPLKLTIPNYKMQILDQNIFFGQVNMYATNYEILRKQEIISKIKEMDNMKSIKIKVIPEEEKVKLIRNTLKKDKKN